MRKTFFVFCFSFLFAFVSNAQMLTRVTIANPNIIGYGAEMFYVLDSNAADSLLTVDTFSEYNLLKLWGLPIMNIYGGYGECRNIDALRFDTETLFKVQKKKIVHHYGSYILYVEFVKTRYLNLCITALNRRYWTCCAVYARKAALLTTIPIVIEFEKEDLETIEKIESSLMKIAPAASPRR